MNVRLSITRLFTVTLICAASAIVFAGQALSPAAAQADTTSPPPVTLPEGLGVFEVFQPEATSMITFAGIDVGSNAYFSSCKQLVYGTVFNMASLTAENTYASVATYDVATGLWTWSNWTPADGITQFATTAGNPYLYALALYAHYENGWHFVAQWEEIAPELDNGFCQ